MGRFTPQEGCLTHLWGRLQPGGSVPEARPAALTRMLGSSRECRARTIASSETLVSPLVWISSTAIWGRRNAAMSACGQALGQSLRASCRADTGGCSLSTVQTGGQCRQHQQPHSLPGQAVLGSAHPLGAAQSVLALCALSSQGCHSPRKKRRHRQRQPRGTS